MRLATVVCVVITLVLTAAASAAAMGEPSISHSCQNKGIGGHSLSPEETFAKYLEAFETLETSKFTPYFHSPVMFVTPVGVFNGVNADATEAIANKVVAQAKEQGYVRSEMPDGFSCEALAPDLASVTGNMRRFNQANVQIAEFGITYLMRKVEDEWKLVVLTIHAPK